MAATKENPIIFYDVASKDGSYWSCNTIKTRLTLNYKGIPYRVQYVHLHEIEPTLKAAGAPPASKTPPHYTLPTIADPSSDPNGKPTYVSETFTIAVYLDKTYSAPKYPTIFPHGTLPLQKIFVDNFSTIGGPLFQSFIRQYIPNKYLTEPALEYMLRSKGATLKAYAHLQGEEAANKLVEIHQKWEGLAETLKLNGSGPFVMGDTVTFADFAVGGMLFGLNRAEGDEGEVWKEVMKWSDGKWSGYWREIKGIKDDMSAEVA